MEWTFSAINSMRFRWKTQNPANFAFLSEPPFNWLSENEAVHTLMDCFFNFETDFEKCCTRIAKEGDFCSLSEWFYWEVHILTYWTYYRCFDFGDKEIKHISYEEAVPIFNSIIKSYVLPKFGDEECLKFVTDGDLFALLKQELITIEEFWNALVDRDDCKSCCDVEVDLEYENFYCTWGRTEGTADGCCPCVRCSKWSQRELQRE